MCAVVGEGGGMWGGVGEQVTIESPSPPALTVMSAPSPAKCQQRPGMGGGRGNGGSWGCALVKPKPAPYSLTAVG